MKIFNWVHRRFKDGSSAQNAKKNGIVADEGTNAKQFLLENNAFDDVFGCWKGGILTIGTFGYDPLMKDGATEEINGDEEELVNHQEFESAVNEIDHFTDSEEEEDEVEQEEDDGEEYEEKKDVNPLVYAVYGAHDYEALLEYDEYSVNPEGIKMNGNHDLEFDAVMMMMKERERKKERITLADLFSADSEDLQMQKKEMSKNKLGEIIKEKANSTTKHGLSFTKKLDSTRPIHKLHRLMRKMLKRKIHPELGVLNKEINGDDQMINYSKTLGEKCDSVPLLQITRDVNDG